MWIYIEIAEGKMLLQTTPTVMILELGWHDSVDLIHYYFSRSSHYHIMCRFSSDGEVNPNLSNTPRALSKVDGGNISIQYAAQMEYCALI